MRSYFYFWKFAKMLLSEPIFQHPRFFILDGSKSPLNSEMINSKGGNPKDTDNSSAIVKLEENDTDSDLDAPSDFSGASRVAPSWYPCDGQI